jgi:hypothetical protein
MNSLYDQIKNSLSGLFGSTPAEASAAEQPNAPASQVTGDIKTTSVTEGAVEGGRKKRRNKTRRSTKKSRKSRPRRK